MSRNQIRIAQLIGAAASELLLLLLFLGTGPAIAQVNRDCVRRMAGFLCYPCREEDNGITNAYRILPSGGTGGACIACSSRCGDALVERVDQKVDCVSELLPAPPGGFPQLILRDDVFERVADASPEIAVAVMLVRFSEDGSNPSPLGLGPAGLGRDYTREAVLQMWREGAVRDLGTPRQDTFGWLIENHLVSREGARTYEFVRYRMDAATGNRELVPPVVRLQVTPEPAMRSQDGRYAGFEVVDVATAPFPVAEG